MINEKNKHKNRKHFGRLRLLTLVAPVLIFIAQVKAARTSVFVKQIQGTKDFESYINAFNGGDSAPKPDAVYTFTASGGNPASEWDAEGLLGVAGKLNFNEKFKAGQYIELGPAGGNSSHAYDAPATNKGSCTTAAPWQQWYIRYYSAVGKEKYYTILNVFSGQLLSCVQLNKDSSHANHLQLIQSRVLKRPSAADLWRFVYHRESNTFTFYNIKSGARLAVEARPGAGGQRATLLLHPEKENAAIARWTLQELPAVSYRDDAVVGFFERSKPFLGSVAFDQGNSIPLSWGPNKGKVLWVTQDSWDGRQLKGNGLFDCKDFFRYRNSMLLQPAKNDWDPVHTMNIERQDSRQNKPRQICDVLPTAEYAWPAAGIEIGRHVYIQCSEGDGLGPPKSQSLYQLTENEGLNWHVERLTPNGMTTEHQINYSAGMVKAPDGFIYVFGFRGTGYGYSLDLHVARFKPGLPTQWTFWNGKNWVPAPDADSKARIAIGKATVSVAYLNGKYIMMTMDQGFVCDSARSVYLATSDHPTGPFTELKKVYTIEEYLYGKYARYYTPVIHPEFNNGHRELLLTYCLNFSGCGVPDCKNGYLDPYFYRIKAIRVPYDMIGL